MDGLLKRKKNNVKRSSTAETLLIAFFFVFEGKLSYWKNHINEDLFPNNSIRMNMKKGFAHC